LLQSIDLDLDIGIRQGTIMELWLQFCQFASGSGRKPVYPQSQVFVMVPQGRHLDFKLLPQVLETFLVLFQAIEDEPQGRP